MCVILSPASPGVGVIRARPSSSFASRVPSAPQREPSIWVALLLYVRNTLTRSPWGRGYSGSGPHQASQVESRPHRKESHPFGWLFCFMCVILSPAPPIRVLFLSSFYTYNHVFVPTFWCAKHIIPPTFGVKRHIFLHSREMFTAFFRYGYFFVYRLWEPTNKVRAEQVYMACIR